MCQMLFNVRTHTQHRDYQLFLLLLIQNFFKNPYCCLDSWLFSIHYWWICIEYSNKNTIRNSINLKELTINAVIWSDRSWSSPTFSTRYKTFPMGYKTLLWSVYRLYIYIYNDYIWQEEQLLYYILHTTNN